MQIEKQLRRVDMYDQNLERNRVTSRCVEIDVGTACAVCHNSIGEAMFVWYPNDIVVHFKCQKSKTVCPATGRDFVKDPLPRK